MPTDSGWMRLPLLTALLTLLLFAAAFVVFLAHYECDIRSGARSHIGSLLDPHWDAFSRAYDRRILLLEGLRGFVESSLDSQSHDMGEKYAQFAAILHRQVEGIRCLSIAPDGTVASIYPVQGNEMLLGHNFLEDRRKGVRAAVARTLASGEISLAGPYPQVKEDAPAFVAFVAIHGPNGFWGMVSSAIDLPPLLKISGFAGLSERLAVAFRSQDGAVFWGDPSVFQSDPVVRRVESFGHVMEVGALPLEGWRAFVRPKLYAVCAAGILGILFVTGATYFFANRHSGLISAIRLRTAELDLSHERFHESKQQAKKALHASEERLRLALMGTKEGLWDWDLKTDLVYFSPRWKSMLGYRQDELEDHLDTWKTLVHPEDRKRTLAAVCDLAEQRTDEFEAEFRMMHKDGHFRDFLSRAFLVRDAGGKAVRLVGTNVDITERKRTEEALSDREAKLRSIFSAASVGIGLTIDRVFQEVNDSLCRMTGYSREELIGQSVSVLYATEEDFQFIGYEKRQQIAEYGMASIETRWQTKEGAERNIELNTTPLDLNDPAKGAIFTALDITERKREQEKKEKLESQLIQAQKMESIGLLAGGIAHDFNNMLSVILGCTELIKARAVLDGPLSMYLQEIVKAAHRSRDITRQLLAFSRKQIISPKTLKLNDHINEARNFLSRMIGEDLHFRFHPGKNLWITTLDPFQLDQILMNLAVNARDAMPGGGTFMVKTANVTIDDNYLEKHYFLIPGEYVLLEITDEGLGMDRETLSHLFEPFFTTKKIGQGTGLGLATVYGIVKQNGGFINVYSEPGQGTCFKVYFPRTKSEAIATASEEVQDSKASATVLLVEDSKTVCELIAGILKESGFTVLVAETPTEALSLCANQDVVIDILVTDVIMPDMNGAELGNRISAMRPGIKMLFMSGYPEDFIAKRGILKEGAHFIQKPFTMKDIAGRIHGIMQPNDDNSFAV